MAYRIIQMRCESLNEKVPACVGHYGGGYVGVCKKKDCKHYDTEYCFRSGILYNEEKPPPGFDEAEIMG